MPTYPSVVVPAIPPQPPPLSLLRSAIRPSDSSDPPNPIFQLDGHVLELLPQGVRDELEARRGDAWTRGFAYAPENHYAGVARDLCDGTGVDAQQLPAPTGLATTPAITGGTLAAATYSYQVTAVNANGQTTALAPVTGVVASGTTGSVVLAWNKVANAATYKVYGRVGGSIGLLATVGPFDVDQPATYTDTGTPAPGAAPPVSNTTGGPGSYGNLPINTIIPWLVLVEDSCSTFGFEARDFKGRALRLLENAAPQAIGKEFWTGALATAKGYPNRFLTDANLVDLTGGTPVSISRGLQLLQDALGTCGFGGQGMIHCMPQTAPSLTNVRRVGNLLLDIFDNIVVPDPGYTGLASGIAGSTTGTSVIIASDLVMVRAEDEGTVFPDTFAEAVERGGTSQPNRATFRAEKFVAPYFDGACQFGVRVTLGT